VAADLHVHSTASDGTLAPSEVVAAAAEAGVDVLALTDHDSTAGWDEAAEAAVRHGVMLVPGLELSCHVGWVSVHLLAYLVDPQDPALLAEITRIRADRRSRARRMVGRIAADYALTWPDVLEQVTGGATVGRPHIADALVARGHVRDRDEAFARILHAGSPYHVAHYAPGAVDAVRVVRQAGGVPVMAHPRAGRRGRVVGDDAIAQLASAGLAGLEVDHRDHDADDRAHLRALALALGLLVTGASDFHGAGKPNRIGEHTTDPAVVEALLAAGSGTAVVRP
jgi:predicted metal-dependent phosphoesterase TrpH